MHRLMSTCHIVTQNNLLNKTDERSLLQSYCISILYAYLTIVPKVFDFFNHLIEESLIP